MEVVGFILVALFVVYMVLRSSAGKPTSGTPQPASPAKQRAQPAATDAMEYLRKEWADADRRRREGLPLDVPDWFFDAATERQLRRLNDMGTKLRSGSPTKGQASDLIGLSEDVEDQDAEVLKFFKVPLARMNQTIARYEVRKIMSDAEKKAAWEARPADPLQKEFLKTFGVPAPKGLTKRDAEKTIATLRTRGTDDDDALNQKLDEWDAFEDIVRELWDVEAREDYDIKKPSLAAIRAAVDALKAEGKGAEQQSIDAYEVAEKLIEMKPELARS